MSRSTRDETAQFTKEEFRILYEIVKNTPDFDAEADLQSATAAYKQVLQDNAINSEHDKVYFSALLRLHSCAGETWDKKLIEVAKSIESELKRQQKSVQRHQRRESRREQWHLQRDVNERSVVQRKLDREEYRSKDDPFAEDVQRPLVRKKSGKSIELTTEEKHALAIRYQELVRLQSIRRRQQIWDHWRYAQQLMHEYRQEQWEYAAAQDHNTLRLQAFEIWFEALCVRKSFEQAKLRRANLAVLRRSFRKWQNHIIERREGEHRARLAAHKEEMCDHFIRRRLLRLLRKSLRQWTRCFHRQRRLQSKALLLRNQCTQLTTWRLWFFRTCERKTTEVYNRKVVLMALHFWLARLHHAQILLDRAEHLRSEVILVKTWDSWRASFAEREALSCQAEQMCEQTALRNCLATWLRASRLTALQDSVQEQIDGRLLHSALSKWHSSTKRRRNLSQIASDIRLRTLFQSWYLEARLETFLMQSDESLVAAVFCKWADRSALRQRETELLEEQARRVLERWRDRHANLVSRLCEAEDQVIAQHLQTLGSKVMQHWQASTSQRMLQAYEADGLHDAVLGSSALARFQESFASRELLDAPAKSYNRDLVLRKTLHMWLARYIQKVEHVRAEKLHQFCLDRKHRLLEKYLNLWSEAKVHVDGLKITAIAIDRLKMFQLYYGEWTDRHIDAFEYRCQALDLEHATLKKVIAAACATKVNKRRLLSRKADDIWARTVHQIGKQALSKWQNSFVQQRCLQAIADNHIRRAQMRLRRDVLRVWLSHVRAQLDQEESTYLEDYSSDSFDASRTRVEWHNQSPPQTPRSRIREGYSASSVYS